MRRALYLHHLSSLGTLGHEAVRLQGDVLVEVREYEQRRGRLPRRRLRALAERDVPQRPLDYSIEGGLLGGASAANCWWYSSWRM